MEMISLSSFRAPLVSCLLICATAWLPAVALGHTTRKTCERHHDVVYDHRGSVELLRHHRARPAPDLLVACWIPTHTRTVIGPLYTGKLLPTFFTAGTYKLTPRYFVAPRFRWYFDEPSSFPAPSRLVRVDVKTGTVRFLTSGDDRATRAMIEVFFVKPNGSVAWTRETQGVASVELLDRTGQRTVDSGPDSSIVSASLALTPDEAAITWIHDGNQMSARFD